MEIVKIDSAETSFFQQFAEYENKFFSIFSTSFVNYYGDEYHLKRIIDNKSILYIARFDKEIVGVSYVKRNHRRGGTAVEMQHRCKGVAERLITESLKDIPNQYSILKVNNIKIYSILAKCGFVKARSIDEIRMIVGNEFNQLSNFIFQNEYFVFSRTSLRRQTESDLLTLVHSYATL